MLSKCATFFCVTPLVALVLLPRTALSELTAADCLKMLRAGTESISSYDVTVKISHTKRFMARGDPKSLQLETDTFELVPLTANESPPADVTYFRQVMAPGNKRRVDFLDNQGESYRTLIIDDEKSVYYDKEDNSAVIRAGDIPEQIGSLIEGADYETIYRKALSGVSLVQVLERRLNFINVTQKLDGIIMDGRATPDSGPPRTIGSIGFRVTLDPQHAMMPSVVEKYFLDGAGEAIARRCVVSEFVRLEDGACVPIKSTTTMFAVGTQFSGLGVQGQAFQDISLVVDVERSKWNFDVPSDLFEIAFPVGTIVTDLSRGTVFEVGQADTSSNIDSLAKHARKQLSAQIEGVDVGAQHLGQGKVRTWLVAINVALILALFIALIAKRVGKVVQ